MDAAEFSKRLVGLIEQPESKARDAEARKFALEALTDLWSMLKRIDDNLEALRYYEQNAEERRLNT